MRQFILTVSLAAVLSVSSLSPSRCAPQSYHTRASATDGWPTYDGAFFTVEYPPNFIVRPSLQVPASPPGTEPYESAFFVSPDGLVEFYVFSPQWDAEPTDILLDPEVEQLCSTRTETQEHAWGKDADDHEMSIRTRLTWVTVAAKDGSYLRSYLDIRTSSITIGYPGDMILSRRTFGIQYADRSAYHRYRDRYLLFRKSLCQYAD
ncbi:MAG: hypothetical protein JXA57_15990 [Armatimonadetes bacterium]|nr:hypothetical protein [Armatimonadota bacterium]